jgi:hypothetical protein
VQHSDAIAELLHLTRSASIFDDIANLLVLRVRAAMHVPARADEETEAQLRQLRERLEAHFPRFRQLYAGLLASSLKAEPAVVADGLRSEAIQRFFSASPAIDRALAIELPQLAAEMVQSLYHAEPAPA